MVMQCRVTQDGNEAARRNDVGKDVTVEPGNGDAWEPRLRPIQDRSIKVEGNDLRYPARQPVPDGTSASSVAS